MTEPPEVWVLPDVDSVRRDPGTGTAQVGLRVVNERPYTVYVAACGDHPSVAVERRVGDGWENAGAGICPAVYSMVPIAVAGQSARQFTVAVREAGRYRVVAQLSVAADQSGFRAVPSGEFGVE
ncbi:MAG TPA: hypothetical protein VF613_05280 [Longimicrobium sp.]